MWLFLITFCALLLGCRENEAHQVYQNKKVPPIPADIKVSIVNDTSVLISWKPSTTSDRFVGEYTAYIQEADDLVTSHAAPKTLKVINNPESPFYYLLVEDLPSNLKHRIWVTATTFVGEGPPSKTVEVIPTSSAPAKIACFNDTFTVTYKENVTLPCVAVGNPQPEIKWRINGVFFNTSEDNENIQQQSDGSLFIDSVNGSDAGVYYCHAENSVGNDFVVYDLIVNSLLLPPEVSIVDVTNSSIDIRITPNSDDTQPIVGYIIYYKPHSGEWETLRVYNHSETYTLKNLLCGTRYQVYVTSFNSIGKGESSRTLHATTDGDTPKTPLKDQLVEVAGNNLTLHLGKWSGTGCPILRFVVSHKKKASSEWIMRSLNTDPNQDFILSELDYGTVYDLIVSADTGPGTSFGMYEFTTLASSDEIV